jgi:hypothetical protein
MFRKLLSILLSLLPTAPMLAAGAVALAGFIVPSSEAQACLPCKCPQHSALNCYGGFHLNTIVDKRGQCAIEVLGYDKQGQKGYRAIYVNQQRLARLPEAPKKNTLIAQYYEYALYKLTSGEYQVNYGPDPENKIYVVIFRGCPATEVKESNYVAERGPAAPATPPKKKR